MSAPIRHKPSRDEMIVLRVPMSRQLYERLLAESFLLEREPARILRDIATCAFISGEMSALHVPEFESVASMRQIETLKSEE